MKASLKFIVLLMLLGLLGCEKDFQVNSKYTQDKLVINCMFWPGDIWKVYLTTSYNYNQISNETTVTNAEVKIYENDSLRDIMHYVGIDTGARFGYYTTNWRPQVGKKYTVKVFSAQYGEADATDIVPSLTDIQSPQLFGYPDTSNPGRYADCGFTITDQPGIDNFYRLSVYNYTETWGLQNGDTVYNGNYQGMFIRNAEGISDTSREIYTNYLFTDNSFKDASKTIRLQSDAMIAHGFVTKLNYHINLWTLSKPLYLYLVTLEALRTSNSSNSNEPAFVYTNVNNGYGIFGAFNATDVNFVIK